MAGKAVVSPDGLWMTVGETGTALRLSDITVARMFDAGDLPGFKARSAIRIYAAFVADALAAIRAGATIDITAFAREWTAVNVPAQEASTA